ncbi:MAG: hypothetical protein ACRD96_19555 [Bryobacteraceae bacterium]
MPEYFDVYTYFDYVRSRWRFLAATCGVAATIAFAASLALPRQFTATARLLIEPPAASDARAAMAVSPIYLESLRTYEIFASSDSLFFEAAQRFGLRGDGRPIDQLKKSVLKVSIPRNTKLLEISVRLGDPKKAQAMAQYIGEEAVRLNRKVAREGDVELAVDTEQQLVEARKRLEEAASGWNKQLGEGPIESMSEQLASLDSLKSRLRRNLASEEVTVAGLATEANSDSLRRARLRAERLREQIRDVERDVARKQRDLAAITARRDRADGQRKAAQAAFETLEKRALEMRGLVGARSERLKIVDPGVVPERPSSPNIPLNVGLALVAALVASLAWVTAEAGRRLRVDAPERATVYRD